MIIIDGKIGGGQILRTALGLSAITNKPIKVINIRGARREAGLKAQHLEGVKAVAKLCNAEVKGAELGSTEIEFIPGKIEPKELNIRIATAGSIGLLFQSLQIPTAFTGKEITINVDGGATSGKWSPPLEFTKRVFLPNVSKMGYRAKINIIKHGFYPKGGAKVGITVYPIEKLKPFNAETRGSIKAVHIHSVCGSLPIDVAKRQGEAALKALEYYKHEYGFELSMSYERVESLSRGTFCLCYAICENSVLGGNSLGELGKPAEKVGREAAYELVESLKTNATFDKYMADQILSFLALSSGRSSITVEKITDHVKTNIYVIEKILPVKFEIEKNKISVDGVGIENLRK
jgi:RNA 3'-phosphate cyclase